MSSAATYTVEQAVTSEAAPDAATDGDARGDASLEGVGRSPLHLRGYARRLEGLGEQHLASAVREYAERVGAVERGELPAGLSAAPVAIAPAMVGAVLVRRPRLEGFLELFRNVLVFVPVLWTWLKLQTAVSDYPPGTDQNFFDFWVETGGSAPLVGGTLADAALQVALILVLLIVVNSLLGLIRDRTERRREREAQGFAAVLAHAEAAGVARGVGDERSGATAGEPSDSAGQPLEETSGADAGRRRLDDVVEQLRAVAGMGDQLAALRAEFAETREAAERSARALTEIRDRLDPSARDFADAAETLAQLAAHVERVTGAMAGTIAALDGGLEASAEHLREAATSLNVVAARVLEEVADGRSDGR